MNMIFVVDQKPLMSILSAMQPMCSKRTTVDTTQYILIQVGHKELVLKSTDLEISLQASSAIVSGSITDSRAFLVSGKRLFELVKELEGHIECTLEENQLRLCSGSIHLTLNIRSAQDFPPFPERIENLMQLESSFLLSMISKVSFLIPQNNANPALNGLFLEISGQDMKMTTTDGHCLAQVSTARYTLAESRSWLVPKRAIFEVKKLLEAIEDTYVFLGLCGNQLVFSGDSFNFFTKLLVDPFPQYSAILVKDGFKPATVDRTQLIKTLRRSACLLSGQFLATKFAFDQQSLHVSMQNNEVGKLAEELPIAEFEGQLIDIRFYAPYLLNGLQAFADEKMKFYLKGASNPIMFESRDEHQQVTYLVMPVSPTAT